MRDHTPIPINNFNGLWKRGSEDEVPLDHFTDCENIKFIATSSFGSRDGIGLSQDVLVPLENIKRIYNYPTQTANTLILLAINTVTGDGEIFHIVDSTTVFGPLLTIAGMTDFAFQAYAGRGYISPFASFVTGDLNVEKGLSGEFLYVYRGDGTAATKAAGAPLTGTMVVANGAAGFTDPGLHVFGFVSETDTGYLSPPGLLTAFTTSAALSVSFSSVDVSTDPHVVKRHLVASKAIVNYNGNTSGYELFFVEGGTINDNTTTVLNNISFFDADLLEDASYLFDNYSEIPAGATLGLYHNRLCLGATFTDISLVLVSAPGEPEAISQIDGLIVPTLDGNPVTNIQEMRDVLYIFKRARTLSFTDNGDSPSSWPETVVDNALGTPVHGIATVLDSGSNSVDYLLVCTYAGIIIFNGKYQLPELSWKVERFWKDQDRDNFRFIQIVNAPVQKEIYIVLPDKGLLVGNYSNGMDSKKIRWSPWSCIALFNTVAIVNIDQIIFGSDRV